MCADSKDHYRSQRRQLGDSCQPAAADDVLRPRVALGHDRGDDAGLLRPVQCHSPRYLPTDGHLVQIPCDNPFLDVCLTHVQATSQRSYTSIRGDKSSTKFQSYLCRNSEQIEIFVPLIRENRIIEAQFQALYSCRLGLISRSNTGPSRRSDNLIIAEWNPEAALDPPPQVHIKTNPPQSVDWRLRALHYAWRTKRYAPGWRPGIGQGKIACLDIILQKVLRCCAVVVLTIR